MQNLENEPGNFKAASGKSDRLPTRPRKSRLPTHNEVLEALEYDPESGVFRWKTRPSNRVSVGDIAGRVMWHGYRLVSINGAVVLAHRLAWFYVHGEWPAGQIDHINAVRGDNRISNLRVASIAENNRNCRRRQSRSGLKGVTWHAKTKKWVAQIKKDYRTHYLGLFPRKEDAHAAYRAAAKRLHGEFARFE